MNKRRQGIKVVRTHSTYIVEHHSGKLKGHEDVVHHHTVQAGPIFASGVTRMAADRLLGVRIHAIQS